MCELIQSCGGDVLKFAGDALMCAWLVKPTPEEIAARKAERDAARRRQVKDAKAAELVVS
jgi:class 3 adenylate cyclase